MAQNIDPATFVQAKYFTPHLVGASRIFDEDGSQTAICGCSRGWGSFLDDAMRQADKGLPIEQQQLSHTSCTFSVDPDGIKDLSGNPSWTSKRSVSGGVDELGDQVRSGHPLDNQQGRPLFPNNIVVTVARRFANLDEDEQPSYYQASEVQPPVQQLRSIREVLQHLQDTCSAPLSHLSDGTLERLGPRRGCRQVVDDLNQQSPPPQMLGGPIGTAVPRPLLCDRHRQRAAGRCTRRRLVRSSGSPLQNPLNPFGCRLQTLWREIDMSLSKTDPLDFNLDVEQIFWAPFTAASVTFDEFDQMSVFLGHSEVRPENCVGQFGALPTMQNSGLVPAFADNYVFNPGIGGGKEEASLPFPAFVDQPMTILANEAITEPNGVYRYLPLPEFQKPYFVWRDERVMLQGGNSKQGFDTRTSRGNNYQPYILSPFLTGRGRYVTSVAGAAVFNPGFWDSRNNYWIQNSGRRDTMTGGLLGSIALPLMADFWVYPDDATKPAGNPFRASGANGWQISVSVQSSALPNYRIYSAGGLVQGQPRLVSPGTPDWTNATGGYTPSGSRTRAGDNTIFWVMADYVKRVSVMTAGFVDILDPHRMLAWPPLDPRLGPYFDPLNPPANVIPNFNTVFEPPLNGLPGGTSIVAEYRGAGAVDPAAWAAAPAQGGFAPNPSAVNFPLDPRKAGDAHIRKFDDRPVGGGPRGWWTYYYNRHVTGYTNDVNELMDDNFTSQVAGPNESFQPRDVRYLNWRFVFENNVEANPPITPRLDSFMLTYRFETR